MEAKGDVFPLRQLKEEKEMKIQITYLVILDRPRSPPLSCSSHICRWQFRAVCLLWDRTDPVNTLLVVRLWWGHKELIAKLAESGERGSTEHWGAPSRCSSSCLRESGKAGVRRSSDHSPYKTAGLGRAMTTTVVLRLGC